MANNVKLRAGRQPRDHHRRFADAALRHGDRIFGIGGESGIFGWPTLLIAHITFNIPYVIFNVGPKLRQLDPSLYNAALDLGCTPRQAFFKVIMPQLSPAILSAFLICLTYSIDDFMISYFNSGTMQTLPIAIYSMTRKKVSPEINALSAVIFCVILAIILISNADGFPRIPPQPERHPQGDAGRRGALKMKLKKFAAAVLRCPDCCAVFTAAPRAGC